MRAPLVRAQKLVGDPSPLHWLTGFDTVSSRAFFFAQGRPAQKIILSSLMIIKRTFDANLLLLSHADLLRKIIQRFCYFEHRVKVIPIS